MRPEPRRGPPWLAAAIAIKVLPAVLLLFLIVRKKYRLLLWTLLMAGLLCLLPVLVRRRPPRLSQLF